MASTDTRTLTVGTSATAITKGGATNNVNGTGYLRIKNIDGAGKVSFRTDGVTAVAEAAGCHVIPAVAGAEEIIRWGGGTGTLSIIASANTLVTISRVG